MSDPGRKLLIGHRLDDELVPVATFSQDGGLFVFQYDDTFLGRGLPAVPGFPRLTTERYESTVLWPFFRVRLPPTSRPDVARVIREERLDEGDVFAMLGVLGRRSLVSPYELAPA